MPDNLQRGESDPWTIPENKHVLPHRENWKLTPFLQYLWMS